MLPEIFNAKPIQEYQENISQHLRGFKEAICSPGRSNSKFKVLYYLEREIFAVLLCNGPQG